MPLFGRKPPIAVQPKGTSKGLLLVLHGFFTQDAATIRQDSGMDAVAQAMGFTVCYPNAMGRNWVERATLLPNPDVHYLEGLIHAFALPVCYALGFSDGACLLVSQPIQGISKVVCYAGYPMGQARVEDLPLWPVLVVHGKDDQHVNLDRINGTMNSLQQAGHVVEPLLLANGGHHWDQGVNPQIQQFLQSQS